MKTITISDEVYEKLSRLKGKRSFSEIIDLLLRTSVERRIDMLIKVGSYLLYVSCLFLQFACVSILFQEAGQISADSTSLFKLKAFS
jgi:hypothetical protein